MKYEVSEILQRLVDSLESNLYEFILSLIGMFSLAKMTKFLKTRWSHVMELKAKLRQEHREDLINANEELRQKVAALEQRLDTMNDLYIELSKENIRLKTIIEQKLGDNG